jgi:hypothetical protein
MTLKTIPYNPGLVEKLKTRPIEIIYLLETNRFQKASGMIKFLTGSCLSGLGIVLKES